MSLRSDTKSLESKPSKRVGPGLRFSQKNQQRPLALPDFQKLAAVGAEDSGSFSEITKQNIIQGFSSTNLQDWSAREQANHEMLMQTFFSTTESSTFHNFPRPYRTQQKSLCIKRGDFGEMSFAEAVLEVEKKYGNDASSLEQHLACTSEVYADNLNERITVLEFKKIEAFIAWKLHGAASMQ